MKIRLPWLVKAAGWTGSWVMRAWMGTLRFHYQPLGPDVEPRLPLRGDRFIYAFWHEYLLLPIYRYCRKGVRPLISHHADGELAAEVCRGFRVRPVRGSTTRGG